MRKEELSLVFQPSGVSSTSGQHEIVHAQADVADGLAVLDLDPDTKVLS